MAEVASETTDTAAKAFDAVMAADSGRARPAARARGNSDNAPVDGRMFANLGGVEVDEDSPEKGGGDDIPDPEVAIYDDEDEVGTRTRSPRKGEKEASKDDDAGPDADDDAGDDVDDDAGDDADDDADGKPGDVIALDEATLKQKVEVTVDGKAVEVPLKEALEGYVRTETFHQRMNQLDEAKKVVRRAAADAVHNYELSINLATEMEAHFEKMIPKEPNWDEEFQKDPAKARELQKYYEQAKSFITDLRTKRAEIAETTKKSNNVQLAAFAEEEGIRFAQLNAKNWTDPKKKAKDLDSMRKTGLAQGFTEEELSAVYDSRMLQVLLKASKYDRMMAAKPKPIPRPSGKPVPPGAGSARQRTAQRGATSAMNRLHRTGSVEDAALVFDNIIARR